MLGNIENSVNFTSLKFSPDAMTKKAISGYVDCMDTARIMYDSFNKIGVETGSNSVVIKGINEGSSILFSAYDEANPKKVLSSIQIEKGDFKTQRGSLFEKFTSEIVGKIKGLIEH